MAYIHRHKDQWRAQVAKQGIRQSAVWPTKREAQEWAARVEAEIASGQFWTGEVYTFGDAVDKYLADVSSKKDGVVWEKRRLEAMRAHFGNDTPLSEIDTPQIAEWRDTRLKTVTGSTVVRDANLLRNLFNVARDEWRWMKHNPFTGARLPAQGEPRKSVWGWRDIRRVLRAPRTGKTREMQLAFHIALRTGMRLGEVLRAPAGLSGQIVTLEKTKTESVARIPVGRIAARLIRQASFTVDSNEGSVLFSKLCRELLIKGLTFHDSRATALTHLSKKVDVMTLAKISRHKDLSLLMNTYYRPRLEEIAAKI